jgi:hypothetical protein
MANRFENLRNRNKFRAATIAGGGILGSLALAACGNPSSLVIESPCTAISANGGGAINPTSWPDGKIQYRFDPIDQYTNFQPSEWVDDCNTILCPTDVKETGYIERNSGNYYLTTPQLESPSRLNSLATNDEEGNFGKNVAVSIQLPEYGTVGFTTGCITTAVYNGVELPALKLPISK